MAIARSFRRTASFSALALLAWNIGSAQPVVGWVDNAKIYPGGIQVHARMDSGAKTSSLRPDSTQTFERNGETWIRVRITDKKGRYRAFERPVVRFARIKRHTGTPERRPVIMLGLCVGHVYKEVEATVVRRSVFNYPLLVGRNFLAGRFLIDSATTFTTKPSCKMARN